MRLGCEGVLETSRILAARKMGEGFLDEEGVASSSAMVEDGLRRVARHVENAKVGRMAVSCRASFASADDRQSRRVRTDRSGRDPADHRGRETRRQLTASAPTFAFSTCLATRRRPSFTMANSRPTPSSSKNLHPSSLAAKIREVLEHSLAT